MPANNFDPTNYYQSYEQGLGLNWDLQLMLSALKEMPVMHDGTFDRLRELPSANLLLLGSATSRNLDNMALLDDRLRPGHGARDTAYVIDYHQQPLLKHQERIDFIDEWKQSLQNTAPGEDTGLQYPSFKLARADMMHLPFAGGSMHVAVSDYTLNFVEDAGQVGQTCSEIARVLTDGGFLLLSVSGNPDFPYNAEDTSGPGNGEASQKELSGGLVINQLPLATYRGIAKSCGLQFVAQDASHSQTELMCGVFQKMPAEPTQA